MHKFCCSKNIIGFLIKFLVKISKCCTENIFRKHIINMKVSVEIAIFIFKIASIIG
jgi:hypothetical protein